MTASALPDDARHRPDRRRQPTRILTRYWLRGRRRGGRRDGETQGIYVDRYSPGEVGLFLAVLLLSVVDLVLTFAHLGEGGEEANPVMAWFLNQGGDSGFVAAKFGATLVGATVLLLHVRFRGVRQALRGLVGIYLVLMLWHGVVALDRW